ncbi:MAG: FAD-binding oxidoreductase [Candidatus Cloacimonetes bacterium]|nr:FAD-binding oxidoreductase [Candidatus Cloacimonadota bacterium]
MSKNIFDVIIIGAGSVGLPAAKSLAEKKMRVLVLDAQASPGQANAKKAIGGIRATHSDYGKIRISLRSIEIFAGMEEESGYDIGWLRNGYSFPAYSEKDEKTLKNLMKIQHEFGLNISWISPEKYNELVPGINMEGLRGSTYSPEDGSASPLLASNAYYQLCLERGVSFRFGEKVTDLKFNKDSVEVTTDSDNYSSHFVVNAAGNEAREVGKMAGLELPVYPDCHEAAITEPVKRFFGPMVVDMRPAEGSKNYYFYQNNEGQVVFCITPDPPIPGTCSESTSVYFPQIARRMVKLYPRLANLKVRRSWRGQYPMTPDGFPIVGFPENLPQYFNLVGMCGQGFMLGPGLGELTARCLTATKNDDDDRILASFAFNRDFSGTEAFK